MIRPPIDIQRTLHECFPETGQTQHLPTVSNPERLSAKKRTKPAPPHGNADATARFIILERREFTLRTSLHSIVVQRGHAAHRYRPGFCALWYSDPDTRVGHFWVKCNFGHPSDSGKRQEALCRGFSTRFNPAGSFRGTDSMVGGKYVAG